MLQNPRFFYPPPPAQNWTETPLTGAFAYGNEGSFQRIP